MIYMLKNYFSCLYRNTVKNYNSVFYSLFKQNKNARLLDCGCWNGVNTKKYGKIVGTDFLYGIEINKQKAKEASKKGIEVKTSDLNQKLPFKDNFFDSAIFIRALHCIETEEGREKAGKKEEKGKERGDNGARRRARGGENGGRVGKTGGT